MSNGHDEGDLTRRGYETGENVANEVDVVVTDARVSHEACSSRRDGTAFDTELGELLDDLASLGMIEGHDVGLTGRGVIVRLGEGSRKEMGQLTCASVVVL